MALPPKRKGERLPQQAVRVGRFEEYMERVGVELREEMSQKMSLTMVAWNDTLVSPLERRIAQLERPLHRKVRDWFVAQYTRFNAWLDEETAEPVVVLPPVPPEKVITLEEPAPK